MVIQRENTSLIIPTYYANEELKKMTKRCINSLWVERPEEVILAVDTQGEGYSKTVNRALKASHGDILIVGNNDLIFKKGWLSGLLKPLENHDISTVWTSDQDVKLEDKIEERARFGSLFAMKRNVYRVLGGFDEQFKGYFADTDYRRRALDAGFTIGKNLNCVVQHEAKATYKQTDPEDTEYLKAMRLYEIKHGTVD